MRTDAAGTIVNEATVSARPGDSDWASNTARATLHVEPLPPPSPDPGVQPVSDLVVRKHVNHRTVRRGRELRYAITIINHGPHQAAGIRLTDTFRLPVHVLSIRPAQGHCSTGPPIVCTLGSLGAGAHTTVRITAIATVAGAHRNTASVASDSWDPNPATSLASARTTVIAPPRPPHRIAPPPPSVTG